MCVVGLPPLPHKEKHRCIFLVLSSLTLCLLLPHPPTQEHRLQLGSKEIFHLEAFVAKFMSLYKAWLVRSYGA